MFDFLSTNNVISRLIESDEEMDAREFDLWRGMAAGSQAQGSWQNIKGEAIEDMLKALLQRRLRDKQMLVEEEGDDPQMKLTDGRVVIFADEPDVAFYLDHQILTAIEIKGGIDTAGVLERVGAAIKSLSRAKQENPEAATVLILQGVSLTPQAQSDLQTNQSIINHWFTVEEILGNEVARNKLFELIGV